MLYLICTTETEVGNRDFIYLMHESVCQLQMFFIRWTLAWWICWGHWYEKKSVFSITAKGEFLSAYS